MKILVCGDVKGNFKAIVTRIENLLKKNAGFDMLFCAGSFFADTPSCDEQWEALKQGTMTVPLPVFILGPHSENVSRFYEGISADGGEIAPDITCLGQRGIYTTTSGLKVAYLSGCYDQDQYSSSANTTDSLLPYLTQEHIKGLLKSADDDDFKGVDILLTCEWPQGVFKDSPIPEGITSERIGSTSVSHVAMTLKPRYHFTSKMEVFYERPPYRNHEVLSGQQQHVTRFIALANVGNPDKKKRYLYAFSIEPMRNMDRRDLVQQPQTVTDNPYRFLARHKDQSMEGGQSARAGPRQQQDTSLNFFFDAKAIAAGKKRAQREQEKLMQQMDPSFKGPKRHKPPQPKGPCWFCLGSAEVEKHLIVSIGNHSYTAIPKGALTDEHILIIPIGHYSCLVDTPKDVFEEIEQFKKSLREFYKARGKSSVMFERNYRSQHLQLQVIPVPECESDALRQAFKENGKRNKLEFMEVPGDVDISQVIPSGAAYFSAEFDDGPCLVSRITGFFPLQFGREVLASPLILNVPERINWKACALTKDEETSSAEHFREKFKQFDFTLDEDSD